MPEEVEPALDLAAVLARPEVPAELAAWAATVPPEQLWSECPRPDWLLWIALQHGMEDDARRRRVIGATSAALGVDRAIRPGHWWSRLFRLAPDSREVARAWARGDGPEAADVDPARLDDLSNGAALGLVAAVPLVAWGWLRGGLGEALVEPIMWLIVLALTPLFYAGSRGLRRRKLRRALARWSYPTDGAALFDELREATAVAPTAARKLAAIWFRRRMPQP